MYMEVKEGLFKVKIPNDFSTVGKPVSAFGSLYEQAGACAFLLGGWE